MLKQFMKEGYLILPKILSCALQSQLLELSQDLVSKQSQEEIKKNSSLGSLINVWETSDFVEIIANTHILKKIDSLGFSDLRFSGGYLFCKPAHSPQTFWHQDWWCWDAPESYIETPLQIGLLYYLQDTLIENGALRVIPGSHLKYHKIHELFKQSNKSDLRAGKDLNNALFQTWQDETTIEIQAGDLVIVDARLLHAAHANCTNESRHLISLWYFPFYNNMPERVRATIGTPNFYASWSKAKQKNVIPMMPSYSGNLSPYPINETPRAHLEI